jgi:hypothetical protein
MCVGGDPLGLGGGAYFFYLHFGQKAVDLNGMVKVSGIKLAKVASAFRFGRMPAPLIPGIQIIT